MNRTLLFGLVFFLALVGISLIGGEQQAVAGHGCHGCHGCYSCHGCYACSCYGCGGCYARPRYRHHRAYYGCHGCYACSGCYGCSGCYSCYSGCGCYGACSGCYGYAAPATIITPSAPALPPADPPAPTDGSATAQQSNLLTIRVPAGAKVIINGHETKSTGSSRQYVARGLTAGKTYQYEIRAQIEGEGEGTSETKVVKLVAGRSADLAFEFDAPSVASVAGN